jgi:hypothetical protein
MTNRRRRLLQLNDRLNKEYRQVVNYLIRKKYSQSDVEAIINNYMDDPSNEKYAAEFKELQAHRAACKVMARAEVYGEEKTNV